MDLMEYSRQMGIVAVIVFLGILLLSRLLRNTIITKPKLQRGALIFGVSVSAILLVWGIIFEIVK